MFYLEPVWNLNYKGSIRECLDFRARMHQGQITKKTVIQLPLFRDHDINPSSRLHQTLDKNTPQLSEFLPRHVKDVIPQRSQKPWEFLQSQKKLRYKRFLVVRKFCAFEGPSILSYWCMAWMTTCCYTIDCKAPRQFNWPWSTQM